MRNSVINKWALSILPIILLYISLSLLGFFLSSASAETNDTNAKPKRTIHFRPGVRFGTDDRTLYIMDFLVPLYQDQKNKGKGVTH